MTVRDVCADFGYQPPTATSKEICTGSIVGPAGTYLAPNSYDATSGGGAYLTELTALDQILSVGGVNYFLESGAGFGMRICVDWVTAPVGGTSIQTEVLTSTSSAMPPSNPPIVTTTMIDFGPVAISNVPAGTRQIMSLPRSSQWQRYIALQVITTGTMTAGAFVAWLAMDLDSALLGYAEGFSIK